MRFDQGGQYRPGHDYLQLSKELLALGLLLAGGELVIPEVVLLALHQLCPGLRSSLNCRAGDLGFPEFARCGLSLVKSNQIVFQVTMPVKKLFTSSLARLGYRIAPIVPGAPVTF